MHTIDSVTKYFYIQHVSHGQGYYALITVTRVQGITKTVCLLAALSTHKKKKGEHTQHQHHVKQMTLYSAKSESSFTKD